MSYDDPEVDAGGENTDISPPAYAIVRIAACPNLFPRLLLNSSTLPTN